MLHQSDTETALKRGEKTCLYRARQLDKYYTRPEIARECMTIFEGFIGPDTLIIEPSAGAGAFIRATNRAAFAYDVEPDHPEVITSDFLLNELAPVFREIGDIAMIGNPPFGWRSLLAVQFLNRALQTAHTVGFILPMSFGRWDTQRKVNAGARLILSHALPEDAFTMANKPYRQKCVFQVWTRLSTGHDLRLQRAPAITHPDFNMMEYRRETPGSVRHFRSQWDFAVRSQGRHAYRPVFSAEECDLAHRWMMFEASDGRVLSRLLAIDFAALAQARPVIPGFAQYDVVACYATMLDEPATAPCHDCHS